MPDFIPKPDAEFDEWLRQFITYAQDNAAALGLSAGDVQALANAGQAWDAAYPAHVTALNASKAATAAKDAVRAAAQRAVRGVAGAIQARPATTNGQRLALGVSVPRDRRRAVPAPATSPRLVVDMGTPLVHRITFVDKSATRLAKPGGVAGCEIWRKVGGPAPVTDEGMAYLGTASRSPHVVTFAAPDAGLTAYYLGRWVSPRGERGPWSAVAYATVGV